MEEEFNDNDGNNEFLSQSYIQGISRITGRKEEDVSILNIPEEIILQRKEAWNQLFLKYSENVADETELDIHTFEPIEENTGSPEINCRLPMRKPSYLIQYWVDTGMPPCKALDQSNHSEPGSSLSEYEQSPLSVSNNLKIAQFENIHPIVRCTSSSSSIDTAVYILSNANTTKKADTIAIMEGAKPSDAANSTNNAVNMIPQCETPIPIQKSSSQSEKTPSDIHSEVTESLFHNNCKKRHGPLENNINIRSPLISDNEKENSLSDNTQTENELHCSLTSAHFARLLKSPLFNNTFYNNTSQYSSNKTDIIDMSPQSTSSAGRAQQNSNNVESDSAQETSKRVSVKKPVKKTRTRRLARVENAASKTFHRRKLYTGRNSPVDLINPVVKEVGVLYPIKEAVKSKQSLHPALESPHCTQNKNLLIIKRAKMRARMKMKKASLLSSTLGDTSQETDPNVSLESDAAELRKVTEAEQQGTRIAPCNLVDAWNILSANLNPVVRLERIDVESYEKLMPTDRHGETIEDENKVKKSALTKQNLLDMEAQIKSSSDTIMYPITNCSYVDVAESDQSTIIMCRCTNNSVRSKVLSDSHCNDNFYTSEHYSDTSNDLLEEDNECENNNNSTELQDESKSKVSIKASNERTINEIDEEAIDDAEVSEIMKESEILDKVVPPSELRGSEPEKISESSKGVAIQNPSKRNRRSKMDRLKNVSERVLRDKSALAKAKSSKSNISMTLRVGSQDQVHRIRGCDDDKISFTSSSISDCINETKSIEDTKREAIVNAEKLVVRLKRLPSNILANKYKKYENLNKKRKVVKVEDVSRKCTKLSEQPKVIKVTKKFFSEFCNNSCTSENTLSCSEESSISGVTRKIETSDIDLLKNGKMTINSSSSQNSSTALVTIGTSINNIYFKSNQSAEWLPADLTSSADESDDIFNVVEPTRKSERRKSLRNIFNISDTSIINLSKKITRRSTSFNKSNNVKKHSSEVPKETKKNTRNNVYGSSELLSKDSGKGTDSSSRIKSTEILTANDIICKPKKINCNRSKNLSVLRTEIGWKNRKVQRSTRNRLCKSEENKSQSLDKDALQTSGRFVKSQKSRLTNSIISSDSSTVSSVKQKVSPYVRLNRRSNVKKLSMESSDTTSTTSNSELMSTRSKRPIHKNGLRPENMESTLSRRSKMPLLKNSQSTRDYTRVRSGLLDFTSDSTDGITVNRRSVGSVRKKRKLEKDVLEKPILPKNDKGTAGLSKLREKYRNSISDKSSSSSDVNGRCIKLSSLTRNKFTESKSNSQIGMTFEKLMNESKPIKSNESVSFLEILNNTSDDSLVSFSSSRDHFEKRKKISIQKDTTRTAFGKKCPAVEKPVAFQAITFHQHSDSDDM